MKGTEHMSDVLNVLIAYLAENFDIEGLERTSDGTSERVCVDLRVSPEQLQAAKWKVIEARAQLGLVSGPADPALETQASEG